MIRIYNTETKWLGRERADNDSIRLLEGEIKLQVIKQEKPSINPNTQRLHRLDPVIDTEAKTYTEGWEVIDLTDYEIAMRDWEGGDLQIRIIAPIQLILDDFGVKMKGWFELRGLPVIAKGEFVHLYCNEIQPQFEDDVNQLLEGQVIQIQQKPEPEDFE